MFQLQNTSGTSWGKKKSHFFSGFLNLGKDHLWLYYQKMSDVERAPPGDISLVLPWLVGKVQLSVELIHRDIITELPM